MTFFAQVEEIVVRVPAGASAQRETLIEALYEWNAVNGRTGGVIFLPVAAEIGAESALDCNRNGSISGPGELVLELLPGDSPGEGKIDLSRPHLASNLSGSRMPPPEGRGAMAATGRIVTVPLEDLASLKATIRALLAEYCSRGQSVPVVPSSSQPEFEAVEIARLYTRWEAEKANCPPTLGTAKKVLAELNGQIDAAAGQDTIDPLSLKREIGELARYRVRTDEGQSYIQFWQRGDRVFERLARAAHVGSGSVLQDEAAAGLEGCGR